MIIARFPNGDWTEMGDGDAVDFLDVDGDDPNSALAALGFRVIASAQVEHDYGVSLAVRINHGESEKV